MSATGRPVADGERRPRVEQDLYQTPVWCVDALLSVMRRPKRPMVFVEPCKADGNILNTVLDWKPGLDYRWCEIREGRDYLRTNLGMRGDLCITNPPYRYAAAFLSRSLDECQTVAYLLRINWMAPRARLRFWSLHPQPTHLLPLADRPSFIDVCRTKGCTASYQPGETRECHACGGRVGPGTDATEYAWFVWDRAFLLRPRRWLHVLEKPR